MLASGCGATLNPTPATGGTSGAAGNGNGGVAGNGGAAGSPASDASADSGCGPDTDLISDPDNCGSCGFRCCNGSCVQGYCFCDGPPGITCCSTDERGADGCYFQSAAVNILINPMNCGTCGNVCGRIRPARPAPASIPLRALQARAGPADPAAPQADCGHLWRLRGRRSGELGWYRWKRLRRRNLPRWRVLRRAYVPLRGRPGAGRSSPSVSGLERVLLKRGARHHGRSRPGTAAAALTRGLLRPLSGCCNVGWRRPEALE